MYQQITMYQTKDGQIFTRAEEAEKHVENVVCEALDKLVNRAAPNIKFADRTAIVNAIFNERLLVIGHLLMTTYDAEPER